MSTQVAPSILAHPDVHPGSGLLARFRRDSPWWLLPATVVSVLGAFTIYSLWTAFFAGGVSEHGPYLSPFYSPLLWRTGPISPAIWVLWSPLAFRATCYYYRKAYYRSFFWDPPACMLGELRHREYRGEAHFPLFLNNLHRFFLYAAIAVVVFLWYDVYLAFFDPANGRVQMGLGTAIMLLNVVLLTGYTFGCHSFRHLVGGGLDCYSKLRTGMSRYRAWRWVTVLNQRHPMWAWISMFSVMITDAYIRLLQHGVFVDPRVVF